MSRGWFSAHNVGRRGVGCQMKRQLGVRWAASVRRDKVGINMTPTPPASSYSAAHQAARGATICTMVQPLCTSYTSKHHGATSQKYGATSLCQTCGNHNRQPWWYFSATQYYAPCAMEAVVCTMHHGRLNIVASTQLEPPPGYPIAHGRYEAGYHEQILRNKY